MTATTNDRPDNLALAVVTIVFTVLALSLGDALIKRISADFALWQIFVLRSVLAVPVLVAVLRARYRLAALRPRRPGWTVLRSLMLACMWIAYYAALPHVALSLAAAVYYTLPLFITLFAALFIGERVGLRGWVAVALGFAGMLAILRPQSDAFNAFALLPLASAILYALAMILTRTRCRDEHPLVLSLSLNVCFIVLGGLASVLAAMLPAGAAAADPFLFGGWIAMGPGEWGAMALLAGALIVGSVGAAVAYQAGPASVVSTFDFCYLAFAVMWGFLIFAEVPDGPAIVGMGLIAAGGILAARRPALQTGAQRARK